MVKEFELKPITWSGKKTIMKALEASGKTMFQCFEERSFPVDVIEACFIYGIEGFEKPADLESLSLLDMQMGAAKVMESAFIKAEEEKKS